MRLHEKTFQYFSYKLFILTTSISHISLLSLCKLYFNGLTICQSVLLTTTHRLFSIRIWLLFLSSNIIGTALSSKYLYLCLVNFCVPLTYFPLLIWMIVCIIRTAFLFRVENWYISDWKYEGIRTAVAVYYSISFILFILCAEIFISYFYKEKR